MHFPLQWANVFALILTNFARFVPQGGEENIACVLISGPSMSRIFEMSLSRLIRHLHNLQTNKTTPTD